VTKTYKIVAKGLSSAGYRKCDNNILQKKAHGFQDPKTSRRMADLYPNVDHVLLGNGTPLSKFLRGNLKSYKMQILAFV